jgi:hypothetical protein
VRGVIAVAKNHCIGDEIFVYQTIDHFIHLLSFHLLTTNFLLLAFNY